MVFEGLTVPHSHIVFECRADWLAAWWLVRGWLGLLAGWLFLNVCSSQSCKFKPGLDMSCRQNSSAAKWNIFILRFKGPLRFSMFGTRLSFKQFWLCLFLNGLRDVGCRTPFWKPCTITTTLLLLPTSAITILTTSPSPLCICCKACGLGLLGAQVGISQVSK